MAIPRVSVRPVPVFVVALCLLVSGLAGCAGEDMRDNLQALRDKQRLIAALRVDLLAAVDAEKSALLSSDPAEAKAFLGRAREAMAACGKSLSSLKSLVDQGSVPGEKDALGTVAADFEGIGAVDATLAELVGRNTNLRATVLSQTEAALAVARLQQALTPTIEGPSCPAAREALRVVTAGLSILSLHPQHIGESTAAGMDMLEAAMDRQNKRAEAGLERLSGLLPPDGAAVLLQAQTAYADFWRVTQEVLRLSRQNTNIEAAALAMGQKRLVTAKALADLTVLETVVNAREFTATR